MLSLIFEKSGRNLKKVYNRLQGYSVGQYVNQEDVLFLAIGGYNRTYELLQAMGVNANDIATFSNLTLSTNFITETHNKRVVYVRKINYTTSSIKSNEYSRRFLDVGVADAFEESMMIYQNANRKIKWGKEEHNWIKPSVVVLDDPTLNLQFEGYRFNYQHEIGFVQPRHRSMEPYDIIRELAVVEETDKMMFVAYQEQVADEAVIIEALNKLEGFSSRQKDDEWYFKPSEFKRLVQSNSLIKILKELPELGIYQLGHNKKFGKENARWVVIPQKAFEFNGFNYKDEEQSFAEMIALEEQKEREEELRQEELLNRVLFTEFSLNIKQGVVGKTMGNSQNETLHSFLADIDDVEQQSQGKTLLDGATTDEEYKHIKKQHLVYFLDGIFKDNVRDDEHYIGGKRLISIDIDDGDYSRSEIEAKLEEQGLFGLVYPTAKYYYDGSKRWRIILLADSEMTKETYRTTVEGVSQMLEVEIDESSKKISQLMGYPFAYQDVSIVIGTMVNVAQFKDQEIPYARKKVLSFNSTQGKSLIDFKHRQAELLKEALTTGIPNGRRNESYRQIIMYLRDTQNNPEMVAWHEEAMKLEQEVKAQMMTDGLDEKEVELICR